ncbi:SMP-30/gluconolactonase/LRE family protein [Candidatus Latescibacterota bacterium]
MQNRKLFVVLVTGCLVFSLSSGRVAQNTIFLFGIQQVCAQGLDGIIAPGAELSRITGTPTVFSADAPCWDDGYLFFTDNNFASPEKSRTLRIAPDGAVTVIREDNGVVTGIKPSGRGTYYVSEFNSRLIIEMDRDGTILRTIADNFNGTPFVGPTGLTVDAVGGIYFTDTFMFSDDDDNPRNKPTVYYIKPDGTVIRGSENLFFPNDIALSPDGSRVYVTNPYGEELLQYVYAIDITPDGTLTNVSKFCELELTRMMIASIQFTRDFRGPCFPPHHFFATSGSNGLAVDTAGNLYVATNQGLGIQVFDPSGKHLGDITTASPINHCAFGGPGMQTLYVAADDGIYTIQTKIPGVRVALGN